MEQIKPDKRYLLATEEDLSINVSLKTNINDLNDFNNSRLISLTELFNKERNSSTKYRIYGVINYLSFLTNKKRVITGITDFFNDDYKTTGFNFEDYFNLKLFRHKFNQQTINNNGEYYIQELIPITNNSDYKLNFFSYSKNIYNEKNYSFNFNTVNLNPYELFKLDKDLIYDNCVYLGFMPKNMNVYEKVFTSNNYIKDIDIKTEFGYSAISFTQAQINKIIENSNFNTEALFNTFLSARTHNLLNIYNIKITDNNIELNKRFIRNYLDIGNSDYNSSQKVLLNQTQSLKGNLIFFNRENYSFDEVIKKEYLIKLQLKDTYNDSSTYQEYKNRNYSSYTYTEQNTTIIIDFWFKFNPFYKIELKKYENTIEEIYDNVITDIKPPDNAIKISGATIWRDLMLYGDIENYDLPFINDTNYYYNDIVFYLKPDLSDLNTAKLMSEFSINFQDKNFIFNKNNLKLKPEQKRIC
jgi:hypothetical protein